MPTIEQWLEQRKSKTQIAVRLSVPIRGGSVREQAQCLVCSGALKVSWNSDMDSWVFEDAMKVRNESEDEQVCHEACYQAVCELECET